MSYNDYYSGRIIVLEGIDFSGTTTQSKIIVKALMDMGLEVLFLYEPYDKKENRVGWEIRQILRKKRPFPGFKEFQKMFVEARRWLLENKITPALKEGKIVVLDRFWESTLAYGKASGISFIEIESWHEGLLRPSLTIFLDVSVEEAERRRILEGQEKEFFEGKHDFQEKVRKAYLDIIRQDYKYDFVVIDGDRKKKEVTIDIVWTIREHLKEEMIL